MTRSTEPTPFERVGGMVGIDAVVELFYDRLVGDPEVAPFFDRVNLRRQRGHLKVFLAAALGGPNAYQGRELGEAHAHLGITDHHVDLVGGHLAAVLAGLGVSPALIDEIASAVDGMRDALLGRA